MSEALTTDQMAPETLTALKGSIAKWEAIVAGNGKNEGPYNCPLCLKFNSYMEGSQNYVDRDLTGKVACCDGCPIKAVTGKNSCEGTPYDAYEKAGDEEWYDEEMEGLAQAELDFLKSLLPKEVV